MRDDDRPIRLVEYPEWIPQQIVRTAERLLYELRNAPYGDRAIVIRLLGDPRMREVWQFLLRRRRSTTRPFEFPLLASAFPELHGAERRQYAALKLLFEMVARGAIEGIHTVSEAEQDEYYSDLINTANNLRSAVGVLNQFGMREAAEHVQQVETQAFGALVAAYRPVRGDFVSVRKHKDPSGRGVAELALCLCEQLFGTPMESISQTLAEVALGRPTATLRIRRSNPGNKGAVKRK